MQSPSSLALPLSYQTFRVLPHPPPYSHLCTLHSTLLNIVLALDLMFRYVKMSAGETLHIELVPKYPYSECGGEFTRVKTVNRKVFMSLLMQMILNLLHKASFSLLIIIYLLKIST